MKYKSYIILSLIAALLCVVSIVFLAKEISGAGQRIHSVGSIRLVNFSFKIGRNFDELARSLVLYKDCRSSSGQPVVGTSNEEYVEKFDILWSGFTNAYSNIYRYWSGTGYWLDEDRAASAARLRESGIDFLNKYEADMSPAASISCARITEMLSDIYLQKKAISQFARSFFELDNRAAEEQQAGVDKLYKSILFLASSFLVTLILTAGLVYRALRDTNESFQQSEVAGQKAMVALNELRESVDSNVAQKKFFAAVSHDLRQPLHALGLYIGSLERHLNTPEARHILNCASLSTNSLSDLLDSLLEISRLEAGVIESNKSEFDVSILLNSINSRFHPEAAEKKLQVVFESEESWVFTDEKLLDRIIQNLLANALSNTDSGHIGISCFTENDQVVISISDTGSGIPELKQEAIFTEFYQIHDNERDRGKGKGLGLGLSIVRRLSELLELSVELHSTEGSGTQFILRLPALNKPLQQNTAVAVSPKATDLTGIKVLLIDDEEDIRSSTELVLQARGCVVRIAEGVESAVQICEIDGYVPDLILADYRLQMQETGVDAIHAIRRVLGDAVPAIIVTGDTALDYRARMSLIKLEVLYKPVETKYLLARIAAMASGAG